MENYGKMPVIIGKSGNLTGKEERFCYEYLIDLNATKAAIRAGYSVKSARSIGYQNLTKLHIQSRIKENQNNLAKAAGITALRIVMELKKIAFLNTGDLRLDWKTLKDWDSLTEDQKACIQEVTTTPSRYGNSISVKFYNKQEALKALTNILGLKGPAKNTITCKEGEAKTIFLELLDRTGQVDPESKKVFGT